MNTGLDLLTRALEAANKMILHLDGVYSNDKKPPRELVLEYDKTLSDLESFKSQQAAIHAEDFAVAEQMDKANIEMDTAVVAIQAGGEAVQKLFDVSPLKPKYKCEDCHDTGHYGDVTYGIKGNHEYVECDSCNYYNIKERSKNEQPDTVTISRELAESLLTNAEMNRLSVHESNQYLIDPVISKLQQALGKEQG